MKGKCNLCGKSHKLPDDPPTEEAPQYIYEPFDYHRMHPDDVDHKAGIYKVLRYPCYTTMIVRPIFSNLELVKEMEPVKQWHGGRYEWICPSCIATHVAAQEGGEE